jgi:hypothetical protein
MIKFKLSTCVALIAALALSDAVLAGTPGDQPIVGISLESTQPIVAKVVALDPAGQTVTLASADGTTQTRRLDSLVPDLGRLKVGDTVLVWYKERLSFVASEPNAATPPAQALRAGVAVHEPAVAVGAVTARAIRNYYVVGVDPAARTISIVDADGGAVRTFSVTDEVAQAQLPRIRPGYKLTVIGSHIVVAAIEKQRVTTN